MIGSQGILTYFSLELLGIEPKASHALRMQSDTELQATPSFFSHCV